MLTALLFICEIKWDAVTALATVALALLGFVTILYARQQLEAFKRESRAQRLIDLVDQFERDPMASHRRNLALGRTSQGVLQPLDRINPPPDLYDVMNFFEHMGYLLESRYVEIEDISVEFHYWILNVWSDAQGLIKDEQAENPIYYEHFEKMVKALLDYDRDITGKLQMPTVLEVEDFYLWEAHLKPGSPLPRQKRRRRSST
jgi:hypothetical protein